MTRLLQVIGVIAVTALVAGSLVALSVVNRRIQVTVQDEAEAAARGPDPVEVLRADVGQLSADLGALTEGVGGQLQALHDAVEDGARARAEAQAAEIAGLKKQVQELQARLDRSIQEEAAARARLDQALAGIGARLDAVAAASAAPEPIVDVPPAVELASEPETAPLTQAEPEAAPQSEPAAAEPPAKGFLSFKLPSRSFAFDKPQRWSILPALSRVGFDAKSTLHDFSGSSQKVEGELVANLARPENGCRGKITVDAASLDTGEAARDEEMRDALGVSADPRLSFEWLGFRTESSDGAAMKTSGTVLGKLTIHGTTHEIEMPVRISVDASRRASVEGEVEIRMSAFGVKPPRKLGVLSVEDTVKTWIALRARSLGEAAGAAGD